MNYEKLHWIGDFVSDELYGDEVERFVVGIYRLIDFPDITVHINTEKGEIIEVCLDDND